MTDELKKKVDESWKEQVEREKQQPAPPPSSAEASLPAPHSSGQAGAQAGPEPAPRAAALPPASRSSGRAGEPAEGEGLPEARFDLFVSSLAIDALIGMGDVPHPVTKKPAVNLPHARYLIDLLGILEEKTRGNLSVDEDRLLKDTLYQLRMRYLAKTGG